MLFIRLQNAIAAREERGAAMAEYGLLLALIALAAIAILSIFGDNIRDVFTTANDNLVESIADAEGGGADPDPAPAP